MKEKNLIILFVILAVLIGLIYVKKTVRKTAPATEEVADIISPSVIADQVSEIVLVLEESESDDADGPNEIEDDDGTDSDVDEEEVVDEEMDDPGFVRLSKVGERWIDATQYGVAANDKTLAAALDKLDQLKGELRSDKRGVLADYGITDEQAFHIKLTLNDGRGVHLLVGTKKAGYQNNFVRLQGSNAVFLVSENLLTTFGVRGEEGNQNLDVKKWADKRITHLDADDVVGISVTRAAAGQDEKVIDLRLETVDDKTKWQSAIPYAFNLSAAKIKKIAENFNNTYAREVIAPDTAGVYDAPGWTGTFTLEGGETVRLARGDKDGEGNNYYLKQEGASYHFLVPVSSFDSRENQQGDIFAGNPLKVEENTVKSLTIEDLGSKKKFTALKKPPAESETDAPPEDGGNEEAKKEDVWESASGESIDIAKVRDVIDKIKAFNVEAVAQPAASLSGAMVFSITKDDGTAEYTVSNAVTLDGGKECHLLKVSGNPQGYCVSQSQVTALQNILP